MTEKPNIVLVTVDSLRADHCGFMGYEKDTTPTLDQMAEDGVVFENAIAPGPSTPESMPVIFTGQWPMERPEVEHAESELEARQIRIRAHMEARDTLAEKLSRLGYNTAAFTPNPFTSRHFGFDQGFDHFQDFMDESNRSTLYQQVFNGFLEGSGISTMARALLNFWQREEVFKPWESYYDEIVEWTDQASEPYFLWVFLMDAHNPYMSSSECRSQPWWKEFHANVEFWRQSHETPFSEVVHERLVTAYDDSIKYSDRFIRQLKTDLEKETAIVVHGDHGEAFGEHGTYGHEPYLHSENVHVPLVVDNGGHDKVDTPVSLQSFKSELSAVANDCSPSLPVENEYVVSKSETNDCTAVWSNGWGYLENSRAEIVLSNNIHSERAPQLDESCDSIVDNCREAEQELKRINRSVAEVVL